MATLVPYPFGKLCRRMFRELDRGQSIFDLPRRKFFLGDPARDFSVRFHGLEAASPLGPAAGPHSQMAQNIVLSWLGGCRILELKTVQILDELDIPRPCIDMQTVGLNAEWSQELKLEESLAEYVKGSMLAEMLRASGELPLADGFDRVLYDMSIGYDLRGIRSDRVHAFIRGMLDARAAVQQLRREIPPELRRLRDLDFRTRISDTVTLSTFHGCPAGEIEGIIDYLMREHGLNCVIKFNPMLLGSREARRLLHDVLGYTHLRVPESAFERDARWEQAVEIVERLGGTAASLGLGLGVKFTNTLIVENDARFLPASEKEVYLSGPPLHILAMHLVQQFRRRFGARYPISFSAGIDRRNFPDAVAIGLVPVTVSTDLLKLQGYGRLEGYYRELARRMDTVGASTIGDFILRAYGFAEEALSKTGVERQDPLWRRCGAVLAEGGSLLAAAGERLYRRWVQEATLLNTEHYVPMATADPRYTHPRNANPPRKIGSKLELFDCVTCDICVPVCPNDANFTFTPAQAEVPLVKLSRRGDGWEWRREGSIVLAERHQIGTFADFCNDCGNCDTFCPEDGGPYIMKPRFFGSERVFRQAAPLDGFYLERRGDDDLVLGRFGGKEYALRVSEGRFDFSGAGFRVSFEESDPEASVRAEGPEELDLTHCHIMDSIRRGVLDGREINYVNMLVEGGEVEP